MQSHESKNAKCEIDAEEKVIVITDAAAAYRVMQYSLGPNSYSFCVQKRTYVKWFLIVRSLSVSLPVTDLRVWNVIVGMRNIRTSWDTENVVTEQGTSPDFLLNLDSKTAGLTGIIEELMRTI